MPESAAAIKPQIVKRAIRPCGVTLLVKHAMGVSCIDICSLDDGCWTAFEFAPSIADGYPDLDHWPLIACAESLPEAIRGALAEIERFADEEELVDPISVEEIVDAMGCAFELEAAE